MGKGKIKKYSWEEKYLREEQLGSGGNASVYRVRNKVGEEYALKILDDKKDKIKTARFIDEIKVMKDNMDIPGVLPIIESNIEEFWYIMPVAKPIMEHLKECKNQIKEVKYAIEQLTETLVKMQERKIAHRDIKPGNLYYYENRYCFGDFGLVDFPEHAKNITDDRRNIGAKFTIAPEMMRYPSVADGLKADIYSMAKAIWMLLTKDELGFEGVYNYLDTSHGLRYREELMHEHLAELEQLLHEATSNAPDDRPTGKQFQLAIQKWLAISAEEESAQKSDWSFLAKLIFGHIVPKSVVWNDVDDMISILHLIISVPAYNHMLLPDTGGMDLRDVQKSQEKGWIDLVSDFGIRYRVKPKCLIFEGFEDEIEWNYFRLELCEEEKIFDKTEKDKLYETLVEDYPAHYVDATDSCYGVYDYESGRPLPENWQLIRRYTHGVFLFVMKYGLYNAISATYDGRHGDCANIEFRKYLKQLIKIEKLAKEKGLDPAMVLNDNRVSYNPFNQNSKETLKLKRNKTIKNKIAAEKFIQENIMQWKFPINEIEAKNREAKIYYFLSYRNDQVVLTNFLSKKEQYLGTDGSIHIASQSCEDRLMLVDKQEAIQLKDDMKQFVITKLTEAGFYGYEDTADIFSIELKKGQLRAQHLFTKDEIEREMRNADDRLGNVLVIDENGFVHVIPDTKEAKIFPVTMESWDARNNYVGKYSSLDSLEEAYLCALEGWLEYLKYGRHVYVDYTDLKDDKEILGEIKKMYSLDKK